MPFTVPNATDLVAGTIRSLDQAEPDSLDFQTVGNRRNGVISGADVSTVASAAGNPTPAYLNVTLSACEVVIDGVYGSITANLTAVVPAAPAGADTRFDVICAFNNSGTFQLDVVSGTASSNNPVFPTIPSSKIPLYAVYVKSGESTVDPAELLIDKRVLSLSSTVRTGTGDPAGTLGSIGDLYLDTAAQAVDTRSGLWVKAGTTTWRRIAAYGELTGVITSNGTTTSLSAPVSQALSPTGTLIQFAGTTAPAGWLFADGSAISRSTYATLFGVIGTTYGVGDGVNTFNLPNMKGRVPVGRDAAQAEFDALGETGGAKTHTLGVSETPSHQHNVTAYSHSVSQSNALNSDHTHTDGTLKAAAASHEHAGSTVTGGTHKHNIVVAKLNSMTHGHADAAYVSAGSLQATTIETYTGMNTDGLHDHGVAFYNSGSHEHDVTGSTGGVNLNHGHSVGVGDHAAKLTDPTGGNGAHNNLQPYIVVNYLIKT